MQIGDLIKLKIFTGHPMGIVTKADAKNESGDTLYWCEIFPNTNEWATSGYYHSKNLEVVNENH